MTEFDDLVDIEGLGPEEEARMRRVHDLLVQAGPPMDLPPALDRAPDPHQAEVVPFPLMPRRRWVATRADRGVARGDRVRRRLPARAREVVPVDVRDEARRLMHGSSALAVIRLGDRDKAGNWPMEFQVTGLARQANPAAYYELWLTRDGKPVAPCGSFRVNADTTTVRLSVPYKSPSFDGWVVTSTAAARSRAGLGRPHHLSATGRGANPRGRCRAAPAA